MQNVDPFRFDSDSLYNHNATNLEQFETVRSALDPNGTFLNALYSKVFDGDSDGDSEEHFVSEFVTRSYPKNHEIVVLSSYVLSLWFVLVFVVYLVGAYFRILPFMDARNLCDCLGGDEEERGCALWHCIDLRCCDDMNELDELMERERREFKKYLQNATDKEHEFAENQLIEIELYDADTGEPRVMTVTFRVALLAWMEDRAGNNRTWRHRDKFAVSRKDELEYREERLGEEVAWKSIYPRQCLFFSAIAISLALLWMAIIEASLWFSSGHVL